MIFSRQSANIRYRFILFRILIIIMLSRTVVQSSKEPVVKSSSCQTQASYLSYLSAKIQLIKEQMFADKKQMHQNFIKQKMQLQLQIQTNRLKIAQLQKKIHELEQKNKQIYYQFEHRMFRAHLVRKQNVFMSYRFEKEKVDMQKMINYLILQNQNLKRTVLKFSYSNQLRNFSQRGINYSPKIVINHTCPSLHNSRTQLKNRNKLSLKNQYKNTVKQPIFQSSILQNSVFESGIDQNASRTESTTFRKRYQAQFTGSMIAKQKRSLYIKQPEQFSTKTQLSPRQKKTKKGL